MQYLTYIEYSDYFGGTADQAAFPALELQARKRIDYLTASRVQAMAEVPETVKICAAALINLYGKSGAMAQVDTPQVTSFNTDGYSESYGHILDADATIRQGDKLVKDMLYGEVDDKGVPLLYRGARG